MTRILWFFSQISSRLWFSASIYGVGAIVTALAAIYLKQFIPEELTHNIGANAVDGILSILAASMLSVTIFSLSTMVSAYGAATNNVTPRATMLLVEDKISHRALSTFLGTFIFSIVCIIALKTGVYGDSGRFVLFVVTVGVITMVVLTLLSWIEYLTRLGRVGETIEKVEQATSLALRKRLHTPHLGATPLKKTGDIPKKLKQVTAGTTGYIQHIDMPFLSNLAEKHNAQIYISTLPGKFVFDAKPIAYVAGISDEDILAEIRRGFISGKARSFKQDPRFGLVVLSEIACRALSPAVNDPGTAIQVIGTAVRVLLEWQNRDELAATEKGILYPLLHVLPLDIDALFDDFFPPVSRDGAANMEVQIHLQQAYAAFISTQDKSLTKAAKRHRKLSLLRANKEIALDEDKKTLKAYSKKPIA